MIVDGVELLRLIRDGELNPKTKIYIEKEENPYKFYISKGIYNAIHLYRIEGKKEIVVRVLDTEDLLNDKYIIPEEDEEIDIQAIKEMNLFSVSNWEELDDIKLFLDNNFKQITDKYNELIKAVKQLNKKIK